VDTQVVAQEIVAKRDKFSGWIKIAALGAVGLFVAPFIFVAIGGLVGLAVAAAVGFTLVQLAPWFALKIANYKYRLMDAEKVEHIQKVTAAAEQNPIETLTALLIAKKQAYQVFKASVTQAITARSNFKDKVEKFKQKYPARAQEFETQLARMTDLVERKKKALNEAQTTLEDGDNKLEEMKAYYEMSKDAIEANRAAGMDTGDAFEKLKADTACDAVFESMNMAFAQLEVAAALDVDADDKPAQPVAQLAHSEPVVLDVKVRETQKVSR
jgi:molybdopterin converting factor small subunit